MTEIRCAISSVSSRVCEHGTKSCIVKHTTQKDFDVVPAQWKCTYCSYGEYMNRADWQEQLANHLDQCPSNPRVMLAKRIEDFAIAYHKDIEGEYGCNGLTCPGVQRLIKFATQCVEDALSLQ